MTISESSAILYLKKELSNPKNDINQKVALFKSHFYSDFLNEFIQDELAAICKDPKHVVRNNIGQVNFNAITEDHLNYSIQLGIPNKEQPRIFKWMGLQQIIGVKGRGTLKGRIIKVPNTVNINQFNQNVQPEVLQTFEIKNNELIISTDPNEIIDIVSISGPLILQNLSISSKNTELYWTFDQDLKVLFAESSSMMMSRFSNMLNVALLTNKGIPEVLLNRIFEFGDSFTKLKAIQKMILTHHPDAILKLDEAILSEDKNYAKGAQLILNRFVGSVTH